MVLSIDDHLEQESNSRKENPNDPLALEGRQKSHLIFVLQRHHHSEYPISRLRGSAEVTSASKPAGRSMYSLFSGSIRIAHSINITFNWKRVKRTSQHLIVVFSFWCVHGYFSGDSVSSRPWFLYHTSWDRQVTTPQFPRHFKERAWTWKREEQLQENKFLAYKPVESHQ